MEKFEIGDIVVFKEDVDPGIFRMSDISRNKEYVILRLSTMENDIICTIRNDIGGMQKVNEAFLKFSRFHYRNKTIDEILY